MKALFHYRINVTNLLPINIMSKNSKSSSGKQKPKSEITNAEKEETGPIFLNKNKAIVMNILAKPGAKQNAITGVTSEGVGVQINAPPTEGEANTELVKYISAVLKLRKSDVTFDKGFKSRNKTLLITGDITIEEVKQKIESEINNT